jgi:filamentous hemagglutinin family protein
MTTLPRCMALLPLAVAVALAFPQPAAAQLVPDSSLGPETSQVNPNAVVNGAPASRVEGGATRGSNLFHSFREFNVGELQRVYFANPAGVANIFSRVTGADPSRILGTLGVEGVANLFLINPNGIIFGRNAQLDVRGSFVGTTANQIQFGTQGVFSATNLTAPGLLTVQPSALGVNQVARGGLEITSLAPAGSSPVGRDLFGLRVPDGQSILLVGGDITVDGGGVNGGLNAQGGRIELGGLAEPGVIQLDVANGWQLTYPNGVVRGNVSVVNNARVSVRGAGGGEAIVNANTFTATDGGRLVAGTEGVGNAGNIIVNANTVNLTGVAADGTGAGLYSQTLPSTTGNGGNVVVNANQVTASAAAQISSSSFGSGGVGNVILTVQDRVTLDDAYIFTGSLDRTSRGGGDIRIDTGALVMRNGAQLDTSSSGGMSAGSIVINARDAVTLDGQNSSGFVTGMFSRLSAGVTGSGGDIRINTGSLALTNGSQLSTTSFGQGNSGTVVIDARQTVTLDDSNIFSSIEGDGRGDSGDIRITTGSLLLNNGSQLISSSDGQGGNAGNIVVNARDSIALDGSNSRGLVSAMFSRLNSGVVGSGGDIRITTGNLTLTNEAQLATSSFGQGNSGTLVIDARQRVTLDNSDIFSSVDGDGRGDSGDIRITTGSLLLSNGAQVISASRGQAGKAGNILVDARDSVALDGQDRDGFSSAMFSRLNDGSVGGGGDIRITTGTLLLRNGAQLNAATAGQGDAGQIEIRARDRVSLLNGGRLTTNTIGQGNAGNITVQANDVVIDGVDPLNNRTSGIFSAVESAARGRGGDITIRANTVALSNGGLISSGTAGNGRAGDISIQARDRIVLSGITPNGDLRTAITATTFQDATGDGGNITLSTQQLTILAGAGIIAETNGSQQAGTIQITADTVDLAGKGTSANGFRSAIATSTSTGSSGNAGAIRLDAQQVTIREGAIITSGTFGQGKAGDITLTVRDRILLSGLSSDGQSRSAISSESASRESGDAGDIRLQTRQLIVLEGAGIFASTYGSGQGGNLSITATDSVELLGRATLNTGEPVQSSLFTLTAGAGKAGTISIISGNHITLRDGFINSSVAAGGTNDAGSIQLQTQTLSLFAGGQIVAAVYRPSGNAPAGQGRGGDVAIQASSGILIDGTSPSGFSSGILTTTGRGGTGRAGDIAITTGDLHLANGGIVATGTENSSPAGNVTIHAATLTATSGGQVVTNTRGAGNAGTIRLNISDSLTLSGEDAGLGDRITRINQYLQRPGQTDIFDDVLVNQGSASGLFANTAPGSSGNGGSILLAPRTVIIRDGAGIFVDSQGSGQGGNIQVDTQRLTLQNRGVISAETASSQGGNVTLNVQEVLLLRTNSLISTTAGTAQAGGNGGNITINAPDGFVAAVLTENSDIRANAFTGRGGNITITAQGIYGLQLQRQNTPFSDITASSQFGISGTIALTILNLDPSRSLVALPVNTTDPATQLDRRCDYGPKSIRRSRFVYTGRGGIAPSPMDLLQDDGVLVEWMGL